MHLYIVRHAWAHEHGDPRWPDDSKRPLETDGAERFAKVIELLAARGLAPQAIATSPYLRCRQTADLIASHTPHSPQIAELASLTPGSDLEETIAWSREQQVDSLCWVGHAPDVGWLTAALIGDGEGVIRFAKGSVAAIRVHGPLEPGCGELQWHVTAKLLGV